MSRPTLLRCASLALALFGTAFVVAGIGALSAPSPSAFSASANNLPLLSFTVFAWPIIHGFLSP